jgi:ribosomal protein S18 acetylase RimI-like enzyme
MLGHKGSDSASPSQTTESTPYIRRATRADVSAIVQLHTICLPHFDLVDPGPAFLRSFYSFVLHDPRGLLLVSEHDHKLAGFVAGFSDPAHLYDAIAFQKLRIFAAASACLVRHPIQLPKLLGDLHRARRLKYESAGCSETACELVTIAVQPRLRRQGHGKALILALAEAANRNRMTQVCVHIRPNDDGMGAFYRRLGFTPLRTFKMFDTTWTDEYILAIQGNGKGH